MPVRKYRSVEMMPSSLSRAPLDPENFKLACDLSVLALRFRPRSFRPGVHKYRSVEEASQARQQWERARDTGLR
jgi:hypothetical protein